MVSVKPGLVLDWSIRRLSQAATKVESHLANLIRRFPVSNVQEARVGDAMPIAQQGRRVGEIPSDGPAGGHLGTPVSTRFARKGGRTAGVKAGGGHL